MDEKTLAAIKALIHKIKQNDHAGFYRAEVFAVDLELVKIEENKKS